MGRRGGVITPQRAAPVPAAGCASWWESTLPHLLFRVVDLSLGVIAAHSLQSRLAIRLGEQVLAVDASHVARVPGDEVALCRRLRRCELSVRDELAPLEWVVVGLPLCKRCLADITVGLGEMVTVSWQEASVALPTGEQRQGRRTQQSTACDAPLRPAAQAVCRGALAGL